MCQRNQHANYLNERKKNTCNRTVMHIYSGVEHKFRRQMTMNRRTHRTKQTHTASAKVHLLFFFSSSKNDISLVCWNVCCSFFFFSSLSFSVSLCLLLSLAHTYEEAAVKSRIHRAKWDKVIWNSNIVNGAQQWH